ncbi:hypothetical protein Cyast_2023 [Cyanobacterium stanieri PCC 7202]|uniref:Inner membrane protein YqiJ N-terminal domain-containing protein n=1 Tax=Cyanobacterium stanieri (strain ATCC 29140 / PCC 7202) TaxID=292563 RepID=K9YM78_CYASC|nr:hypothetical protein Cyast_2023 [Cyanobacterium stanieri PCC 7202]
MLLFDINNLTYWIFLGIGVFLFLLVIISGGGEDQDIDTDADFDLDADADFDADAEAESNFDADMEADESLEGNFLLFLSWFGVGKSPLLILLAIDFSSWGVIGWFLNVTIGGVMGEIPQGLIALAIFVVSLAISLWIGRILSNPIGKIFANFGEEIDGERLIGCTGHVISSKLPYVVEGKVAQADVLDNARNLVTVEAALPDWAKVVPHRGQEILIIDRQQHCYIAIAKDTSDEDKWLNSNNN